jgi:hypothetical protein
MRIGFIKQILKRPADIPELTLKNFKASFETLGYITLSGRNRILKFQNFPNKTHPNDYIFLFQANTIQRHPRK